MYTIIADKIRNLFRKVNIISNTTKDTSIKVIKKLSEKIIDFRIEKLSRLSRKTMIVAGISTVTTIAICGAFILTGLNGEKEVVEPPQVISFSEENVQEDIKTYYSINIDDVSVALLSTEDEAKKVLDDVAAHYSTEGAELVSLDYREKVEIVEKEGVAPSLVDVEQACSIIITGTKEPKVHTVESGDCLWDIAVKNGMSVEELIDANPSADVEHLKIGSALNLYELKPYVNVTLKERVATEETINYDVIYEETSTLYKGEIKVKTAGVYGKRQVKKELVKENGIIVSTTELESSVVSEPSPQINLKGTKSLATLVGTGSFVSPMGSLEVSSAFGSRGGSRHTGVDLRNPKGTPIYVVDDGVVTFSGYSGSYGNIVKVSHGNGIETYYAHCDKLLVSKGAVLKKGQQIATVGITGRATGYHLHFEVRKNGVPQNPMNYL